MGRVRPLPDEAWYQDPSDDLRLERLLARHVRHGKDPADARSRVTRSDEPSVRLVALGRHRRSR